MLVFIIRRLLQSTLVIVAMSIVVFVGIYAIGNPVDILISPDATQIEREAAIRRLGLDRPLWLQYFYFVGGALSGDLGNSFVTGDSALGMILERMPATLELAVTAMVIAVIVGIPLGLWAALHHRETSDSVITSASILGFSLPNFWQGMMLILIFAVMLDWLPSGGRGDTVEVFGIETSMLTLDGWAHLILPALNLAIYKTSLLIRLTRGAVREVVHQDYIKFARARGLAARRVVGVHILKNIMIPVVTIIGMELGSVIAFAVVTETVFAWPGMGKLIIDSIYVLDRPVVVAYLMIIVFLFIIINLVVDILYSLLDPRIRLEAAV